MMPSWKQFGLMIGVVSQREDAEAKLGRVKVTYPTLENIESDWARVLAPYGGSGHGFQSIPEVGDEVVVAFVEGDPKIPLVVGSVYSMKNKPPSEQVDERVFKSRKGHTITVSDQKGEERIEIKTASGQRITLDEDETEKRCTIEAHTVVVDAQLVRLGAPTAKHPAVLGDELKGLLETLLTELASHVHPPLTTPSPALVKAVPQLMLRLNTLLSGNVKVK